MKKKKMSPYHKNADADEIEICLNCTAINCKYGDCAKIKKQRKKKGI